MCYSAQIQAAYMKYLRETGAEMDVDQFVEIFGARVQDSSIRIPRAVERLVRCPSPRLSRGDISCTRPGSGLSNTWRECPPNYWFCAGNRATKSVYCTHSQA